MKFTYVLTGWEGSAADARVLRDAVTRNPGLKVPEGNYYLCDNGYTNAEEFLPPYKDVRYHLDEWGDGRRAPQNYKEFFNMIHARARNIRERTFGLLKMRWRILQSKMYYPISVQNDIILACCLIHNFIRLEMDIDPMEHLFDVENVELHHEDEVGVIDNVESTPEWSNWRDELANTIGIGWNDTTKMIDTTDDHWANFLKTDASAKNMRFKSWPFYPDWLEIFGKDRATGEGRRDWVAGRHANNVKVQLNAYQIFFHNRKI
ncbi:UNVERIFIED_CONTAM: hypothetical protein Slati_0206200 [Sesamum latifolium]|uniref:DDE Tnp4 domain-containing protein n=1 Tax=Sesamum latifolium TaxID=2727402 RepID=A0AAW2YBU6_9LAMI